MHHKLRTFMRDNPIPFIALLGLLGGVIARWGVGQPQIASWIWMATLALGGAPLVWETLRGMLRGQFASDVVAMLAISTAVVMGEYFAGIVIVLMQSGGEALENYALRRASSSLDRLLARAPRVATRKTDEGLQEIDVAEVCVGDTLIVRPGDLIPVDGSLLSERADIDEAALTGEALAEGKQPGDRLLSGSVNVGSAFEMRADKLSEESQYAKIVQLVRKAQEEKPAIQRLADRYAVWFTPLTLAMCGVAWALTGDPRTILSVLVVATPCPLILATPIAIIGGINRAAEAGIIVKGGVAIEQIGQARTVVFDKTGTLTYGTPVIERVVPFNGVAPDGLLYKAGSVEQLSSHVLGRILAQTAQEQCGSLALPTNFRETPGRGVEGEIEGQHVMVGSPRFLAERLGTGELRASDKAGFGHGLTALIAIDRQPAGAIQFNDQIRPGVPELMHRLRELGVRRTVMLTGDHVENAEVIARAAGIDQSQANLLPQDKVAALEALKQRSALIVMVGDGINDAPALATATVGVALGAHGTGISAEAADIVLLVDDVTKVGDAVAIGQRMLRIAKQSIYVGLGLSFACMVVASFGLIPPTIGALLQEAIDVAVILNALRAR
ncbi:MAG TPA: heavy metal translocating P-type ATPase [Herpetosiphonaceae bacterium]